MYIHQVELHIHLAGAMRPSTVWELAKKRGVDVPGSNAEELAQTISNFERGDLFSFLKTFRIFMPTVVADKDALRRISYELCEDKAREGVVYFEARVCPPQLGNLNAETSWYQDNIQNQLSTREVMATVIEGLEAGQRDFNIKVRLILAAVKEKPEWATECLQLCKEFPHMAVGMDIVGKENVPLNPEIIRAFQEAERCGIHRTVHAGEDGPASNVKEAIELLKAERIGHGYHVLQDDSIYQMIKDSDVHLEVCPTSSVYTGSCDPDFSKHPGVRFTQDKINFSLNTDDPLVFRNTINDEFEIAKKHFGLSDDAAIQVTMNSARSAFLPEQEKLELIQQLRAAYNLRDK
ncbi:adenosine deaminase-like isoform X2 [Acanthaster planci]|uniref:Adenosine deaminase n=1 Tax=Acanthaster planci TaxID=133434 RepID=A0A8B7Y6A0_ACAPL|nr:adenosine deaminase-like isoform X2 [Acanthaster planci]